MIALIAALLATGCSLGHSPALPPSDRGTGHYVVKWRTFSVSLDVTRTQQSMDVDGKVTVRSRQRPKTIATKELFQGASNVAFWGCFDDGRRLILYVRAERVLETLYVDRNGAIHILNGPWEGSAEVHIATPRDTYFEVHSLAGVAPDTIPRSAVDGEGRYLVHWNAGKAKWEVAQGVGPL